MSSELRLSLQFLLAIGVLLVLGTLAMQAQRLASQSELERAESMWEQRCSNQATEQFTCQTFACEIALRKQRMITEHDAISGWSGTWSKQLLYAQSTGTDGVAYWACEVQGATVSQVARAKESAAQPYFSSR